MENTLENKAKFFALYLGQKVMRCKTFNATTGNGLSGLMNVDVNSETIKENWFLELKPLSSISDEDAIEVSKIVSNGRHSQIFDTRTENIKKYGKHYPVNSAESSDYLRSRGYALPWMGISVEELVNRGWLKLKGENKL